jgi:hypothetical protein
VKRLLFLSAVIIAGLAVIRSRRGVEVWHSVDDTTSDKGP